MRHLLAMLLAALLGASTVACGEASKSVQPTAAVNHTPRTANTQVKPAAQTAVQPYLNDGDHDPLGDDDGDNSKDVDSDAKLDYQSDENSYYQDSDDRSTLSYGSPANAEETKAITAVVERYYATAAAGNGADACSQIVPGLVKAVPLDYGKLGPSYVRGGKTCAAVMTLLFKHYRKELAQPIHVTSVRVQANDAFALFGSKTMPASEILVTREGAVWKIAAIFGASLG